MPTETPMNTFAIPVTVTYWFPVFGQPSQQPQQPSQPPQQPSQPPQQPSQQPQPQLNAQPTQQQQAYMHPFQAMMQAMMSNMMSTPTPPNSPSHQQQQQQQQQATNIPLPVLLNMMWSLQGGMPNGMTPEMMASFMQGGGNKPPPVTATKVIDGLSKYTYHEHASITPSMTTCSVCQDDFTEGDQWTSLPCQHPYHVDCITPWLKQQHHTCPSCRYPLETDDNEYNQRTVFPTQQTWKHTANKPPSSSSEAQPTCCMSQIHHSPCTLLSGNPSQVTLNCHHTYHLECLHTAQRVLSNTSSSHGEQIVTCPICHQHQSFPVHLSHLIQATKPTSTPTASTSSTPIPQPMMSPKEGLSPKDIDIPFEFPTTSTITSSPQTTPVSPSQIPTTTSLNGTATIQDDVEMTDA